MNEERAQQDREKEKKTNTKLAVAIGLFGMGAFGFFYVLFFLTMILKPGLLFSVIPVPTVDNYLAAAVSLAATLKWQRLGDLVAETVVVRQKNSLH